MRRADKMQGQEPTSKGWALYIAFAVTLGLLWLERHAALTSTDHTVALLAIVLAFFTLTLIWLGGEGGL